MYDEAWKEFWLEDRETKRALDSSEVFRNYATAELKREALREAELEKTKVDDELALYENLEKFREVLSKSPALQAKFAAAKKALADHPELVSKVDPNFINGLKLLDLEGDE